MLVCFDNLIKKLAFQDFPRPIQISVTRNRAGTPKGPHELLVGKDFPVIAGTYHIAFLSVIAMISP